MKHTVLHVFILLCLVASVTVPGGEARGEQEYLPDFILTIPEDLDHRRYLGLTGKAGSSFSVKDIQADILLIELFSMYCPYCQKEAPAVNELYMKMEEVSQNGPVVKIIGLGASNSQFEVDHFRDTYGIDFPLFPDREKAMFRALSGKGTPTFIGCRMNGGEKPIIVLRKDGGFFSSSEFLQELIEKGRI
jgi:peroxiredoxin